MRGLAPTTLLVCWSYALGSSTLLRIAVVLVSVSLTTDDFAAFMRDDPEDEADRPLGDALDELALDVKVDAVDAPRDVRERL